MRSFRKRTRAQWRNIIAEWQDSRLGVHDFCVQHGLTAARFYAWRKQFGLGASSKITKLGDGTQKAIKFLPVQIKPATVVEAAGDKSSTAERVDVFLQNGAFIRISGKLSEETLSKVMTMAGGVSC